MKSGFLYTIIALLFITIPVFGQKETRDVGSFHRISFGIPADLYLQQGDTQSVQLEGDHDDLDKIETEVVGGQLRIRIEDHSWWHWNFKNQVTVYITVPDIDEVSLGGSGHIMGSGTIKSGDLRLSVSGSGKMELKVNSNSLKLDVSGSGRMDLNVNTKNIDENISGSGGISLAGNADTADLEISGSGKLDATDLDVKTYDISISGSGRSNISVSEAITANISGSGSVLYKGSPDKVISRVSGSGKVRKMD